MSKKQSRNISGLRNQRSKPLTASRLPHHPPALPEQVPIGVQGPSSPVSEQDDTWEDTDWDEQSWDPRLKTVTYLEIDSDGSEGDDDDNDSEWKEIESEQFSEVLLELAIKLEDDARDLQDELWLTPKQQYEKKRSQAMQKGVFNSI